MSMAGQMMMVQSPSARNIDVLKQDNTLERKLNANFSEQILTKPINESAFGGPAG